MQRFFQDTAIENLKLNELYIELEYARATEPIDDREKWHADTFAAFQDLTAPTRVELIAQIEKQYQAKQKLSERRSTRIEKQLQQDELEFSDKWIQNMLSGGLL